jgi:hypothetical protein
MKCKSLIKISIFYPPLNLEHGFREFSDETAHWTRFEYEEYERERYETREILSNMTKEQFSTIIYQKLEDVHQIMVPQGFNSALIEREESILSTW